MKNINKKEQVFLKVLISVILLICLGSLSVFGFFLLKLDIIPGIYLGITGIITILILLSVFLVTIFKKSLIIKVMGMVIIGLFSAVFMYSTTYLNTTYKFLAGTHVKEYDTITFNMVVLNSSGVGSIKDLEGKTIAYLDDEYYSNIKELLNQQIDFLEVRCGEFGELMDLLQESKVDAIVLEESYYSLYKEEIKDFENTVKVIYDFEILVKSHIEEEEIININEEPFIFYISGIDQWGNVNTTRGRSDVNQLVVVNPKTNKILIVNTPRDYYVKLHGTTGLKDKLTHAGIYGIDKSIATLEDLYEIDIDYYLRVNFNSLIKVVDAIGGIDIYSDKAFIPWTNKKVSVKEGWNHFNGAEALAYSRERYTYKTGDRHRGENQQQVITAIIDKASSSKVLISKYNSILESLDGSFQTDMDMKMITSFIRYQIKEMPSWEILSISVTGSDKKNYTYSMGNKHLLYVMEPNINSINIAKNKINEVLDES